MNYDQNETLELLSVPAVSDDLTPALTKRPRLKLPSATLALGATLLVGVGFFSGALTGKHLGSTGGSSRTGGAGFAGLRGLAGLGGTGTGAAGTGAAGTGAAGGRAAGARTTPPGK